MFWRKCSCAMVPTRPDLREILHSEPFPDFVSGRLAKKAATRLSSLGLKRGEVFIKFGKVRAHGKTARPGRFAFNLRPIFAQTDHNGAVGDDELTLNMALALTRDDRPH